MILNRLSNRHLVWLGLCGAAIVAFLLLFVLPNLRTMKEMDNRVATLTQRVQSQELLHPVYRTLIRQSRHRLPEQLPIPADNDAPLPSIDDIQGVFTEMAREHRVVFESAAPDPASYLQENTQLVMNVVFSGDFVDFQPLLFRLCQLPYINAITSVGIHTREDRRRMALRLVLNPM
ncbi:hypothetical protein [Desulfatitalea alkaliphila]|uniref:Uncharacterized protein n=1 Tax=Desulfatitalea alkaliphila TaxID=2929485 RepID=A0AA41R433_9BACT|nr:hypothetical protein [Desulfatitalea alkaliphila]MCJ8501984.1 hypothetical protein [Desulfatitalea alkaliphila]